MVLEMFLHDCYKNNLINLLALSKASKVVGKTDRPKILIDKLFGMSNTIGNELLIF
jgi:hypothetical protein